MNNKVVNKQIPLRSIIDVANYLEDYKEKWDKIFQQENEKNKNKPFGEKNYKYENTIKHRKIRTQCFTISVGIILSYILYIILRILYKSFRGTFWKILGC